MMKIGMMMMSMMMMSMRMKMMFGHLLQINKKRDNLLPIQQYVN